MSRADLGRKDSFNDLQDNRNAKTIYRERTYGDNQIGETNGVKVNDSRETLLRALKAVVRPIESPTNGVNIEDCLVEEDLQQRLSRGEIPKRERNYLNCGYYGNTFSPSRSLNFKDGVPASQARNA